jgi:Flp pilus assembly protein TadB
MYGGARDEKEMPKLHRMEEPVPSTKGPQVPVSAIVLASVGGMLLFMGLFFLLVAGLGVGGFLVPALIVIAVALMMMLVAWNIWRKTRVRHEEREQKEQDRLLCDYCGGMNAEGDLQCRFCGAPLR